MMASSSECHHTLSRPSTMTIEFPRITCNNKRKNIYYTHEKICCCCLLFNVCCTYHHADGVASAVFVFLDGLIDYHVHEWIEAAQDAGNAATTVQFQCHAFVHESESG